MPKEEKCFPKQNKTQTSCNKSSRMWERTSIAGVCMQGVVTVKTEQKSFWRGQPKETENFHWDALSCRLKKMITVRTLSLLAVRTCSVLTSLSLQASQCGPPNWLPFSFFFFFFWSGGGGVGGLSTCSILLSLMNLQRMVIMDEFGEAGKRSPLTQRCSLSCILLYVWGDAQICDAAPETLWASSRNPLPVILFYTLDNMCVQSWATTWSTKRYESIHSLKFSPLNTMCLALETFHCHTLKFEKAVSD